MFEGVLEQLEGDSGDQRPGGEGEQDGSELARGGPPRPDRPADHQGARGDGGEEDGCAHRPA
jgi:hypothetical protein